MKKIWLALLAICMVGPVFAGTVELKQSDNTISRWSGNGGTAYVQENGWSYRAVTGDTQVKASAGVLHSITCNSDAAATAGSIIVYDNTAESGTQIWNWSIAVVEYQPRTLLFDVAFNTGLYIGYTTTADVNCTLSYR